MQGPFTFFEIIMYSVFFELNSQTLCTLNFEIVKLEKNFVRHNVYIENKKLMSKGQTQRE